MKKMIVALLASITLTAGAFAQAEAPKKPDYLEPITPVACLWEGDEFVDVIGLRLSAWSTCQDMTGIDLAIGSNSAGSLAGVQVALLNKAIVAKGVQVGLVNQASDARGLQIGLINTSDIIYGYQIGLINVIKGSALPCFPLINFMLFDE